MKQMKKNVSIVNIDLTDNETDMASLEICEAVKCENIKTKVDSISVRQSKTDDVHADMDVNKRVPVTRLRTRKISQKIVIESSVLSK